MNVGDKIYVPDGEPDQYFSHIGILKGGMSTVDRVIIADKVYFQIRGHSNFKTYIEDDVVDLQESLKEKYGFNPAHISIK
jgi:hypothetical protein